MVWLYCGYFLGPYFIIWSLIDWSIDWLIDWWYFISISDLKIPVSIGILLRSWLSFITASLHWWVNWEFFLLIIIVLPMRVEGDNGNQYSEILSVKTSQRSHVITSPFSSLLEFFAKAGAVTLFNTCIFNNQSSAITFLGYSIELSNSNFLLEDRLLNNVLYIQSFNIS